MYKLGITGGIGSGKSAATQWFESQGIQVVDADIVAREVVEKGQPALQKIQQILPLFSFRIKQKSTKITEDLQDCK